MSSTSYGSITVSNLRSITNVVNYYLATSESSGVTKSTDGWTTGIQTMTSTNQYLWNYEETILGDGTVLSSTSPIIIGRYGQNGGTGRGIAQIQEHYLAISASSGVTTSTSGWKDTVQATTSTNRYLWNYETITWTSGTPLTTDTDPRIIGTHGLDGRTYSIEFSNSSIKQDAGGTFTPSTVTVTAYYRDGTSTRQTYAGRIHVVGNKSDGSMVVIQNASSATNKATYTLTPNATYVSYTISLYAAGGATTLLAIETLPIVSDGTSVTSVTTSKSGDETTITISMSDGTSKQFKVKDGGKGDTGATAQWYYGDKLSHTSGSVTKTTSDTATPDAVVGSMYLNPNTSLCYRCTAVNGSNATWTYAGDLTTGVINNIEVGGRNLLRNTSISRTEKATQYGAWNILKPTYSNPYLLDLEEGEYVFSFDWEADTALPGSFYVWVGYGNASGDGAAQMPDSDHGGSWGEGETSGHVVRKFIWPNKNDTYPYFACRPFRDSISTGNKLAGITFTIMNAKLEKGNIPTDWTPAPEDLESSISSVNTTLANYISTNDAALAAVKDQADKSFDTWFYSGQPTASNAPANTWTDNATKALHVGDMYYDTATGKAYTYNSNYQWVAQSSSNIASTDAITAAQTLANSKIKTYAVAAKPTSGMSSGDLWIDTDDNNRMYRYNGSTWVDVQTEINVGGRNLIKRTDYSVYGNSDHYNNVNKATFVNDRVTIQYGSEVYFKNYAQNKLNEIIPSGTELVGTIPVYSQTIADGNHRVYVSPMNENAAVSWIDIVNIPTGYTGMLTWTYTTTMDTYGFVLDFDTRNSTSGDMVLGRIKLERGNTPTDWSPAPEDTEAAIANLTELTNSLQNQIDSKIETWTQVADPATSWNTDVLKESHVGDLWYYIGNTTTNPSRKNNSTYKYTLSNGTYSWVKYVSGTDMTGIFDKIDGKSTIFYGTTSGTYTGVQVGDYLVDSTDGSTYRYFGSSWVKVTDYKTGIDEAKQDVVDLDESLNDPENVFNRLTNNGQIKGINLENGGLYINADYINTGQFTVTDDDTHKEIFRVGNGEVFIKALSDLGAWFDFSGDGLIIGKNNSKITLHLTNREMGFYEGDNKIAYINDNKLCINSAEVKAKDNGYLMLGDFAFIPQSNGNLSFRKVK